jgi:hypothetical protein
VYTYNTSSGSKLYINGVQVGQNSGTARGSNAATLGALFRNAANANNYFNGAMDDVRVYNKTLSAAEVKQLYQLGTMKVKP